MTEQAARLAVEEGDAATVLIVSGHLDAAAIGHLWRQAMRAAHRAKARDGHGLSLDLTELAFCDTAGAAFLGAVEAEYGAPATILGASARIAALLERARAGAEQPPAEAPESTDWFGPAALRACIDGISFLGELAIAWLRLPVRLRMLRFPDLLRYADQAGVQAVPLVILLGYLMGLILAFQSAIPMRRFGADLYVANLVSVSLLRELGPLLAAVILAGRTGSAFAAEIGSMKVNQEVDALVTMSLDPVTMLVLPRLVAAMLVMPALALVLDLAGLMGMTTVMHAFGYPLVTIANQVRSATTATDLFGGLFKGLCFGSAVATIGCHAGLRTGVGPRAVGQAATAAVVGGIVATIFLDGLFALLFYRLNL